MIDSETRRIIATLSDEELVMWPDEGLLSRRQIARRRELLQRQRRRGYSWAERKAAEVVRDQLAAKEIAEITKRKERAA